MFVWFFFLGAGTDQKARAGSGEGSGEVWRVDMKEVGGEGETGKGQWGGGDWEGEMGRRMTGRGATGRGDGEGAMGRGRWGGGTGREGKDGGKHIECLDGMRLHFFLILFTHATPGTPASLY